MAKKRKVNFIEHMLCTLNQTMEAFLESNPVIQDELIGLDADEQFNTVVNDIDYCNLYNCFLIAQLNFFIHGD